MKRKLFLVGSLLALVLSVTLIPTVALADGDDIYDEGLGWCHGSSYGFTTLSDRATLNRVASALGLTRAKLLPRLRDGETVAEIAASKNIDLQKVVSAALARHKDLLQRRVEYGDISQTQADRLLRLMEEEITSTFEEGDSVLGYGYYGYGGYGMGPWMMGSGHMSMGGMMGGFGWR